MIAHMLAVIALALLSLDVARDPGTVLTLSTFAGDGLPDGELGGGDEADVAIDAVDELEAGLEFTEVTAEAPVLSEAVEASLDALLPAEMAASPLAATSLPSLTRFAAGDPGDGGGSGSGWGDAVGAGRGHGTGDGDGSGSTRTSMFDLTGEGGKFVYVFDRSQSMSSVLTYFIDGERSLNVTPLGAAKQELLQSLEDLNESHQFQIVFYNDEYSMFLNTPSLFVATYAHKQLASQFVEGMRAESQTHHLPALSAAVNCRPDVIFLLTDGEAKDELSPTEVKRLTRICKRQRTQVNVIQFCVSPRSSSSLMQLAEATGGRHRFVTLVELAKLEEAKNAAERAKAGL